MSRVSAAFRSFFSLLFSGILPEDIAREFGFVTPQPLPAPKPAEAPGADASDGALQILAILQRDSRLIDFLMEDIAGYADDQVGAAVRTLHADSRATLLRHLTLAPVIDGVEGTYQKLDPSKPPDPLRIKLIGNIPPSGKVPGGTLRHRGWMASGVKLPVSQSKDLSVLAPAELEVE